MKKLQQYKTSFIISIIVILFPIVFGLLLWDQLPEQMALHFDVNGNPDSYFPKAVAVFGTSILMLVIHLICVITTSNNLKDSETMPNKVYAILMWFIPILTIVLSAVTYAFNLGYKINITFWILIIIGFMFMILGNYIPKIKTNNVIGTRVKWTYNSKKNWEHTSRFSGWVLFITGLLFIILALLNQFCGLSGKAVFIILISSCILLSGSMFLYSYLYYKNHNQDSDYYN